MFSIPSYYKSLDVALLSRDTLNTAAKTLVFFSRSGSVVALCCLEGSASACWWVVERNRCGPGEKAERGFKEELRGSYSHLVICFTGTWRCGGKTVTVRFRII